MQTGFNSNFKSIGEEFRNAYFSIYDNQEAKPQLLNFYLADALLTFEGAQVQGKEEIVKKHLTIKSRHAFTKTDCQPTSDGGVLVVVLGQVQTDGEDKPLGFSHTFVLKDVGGGRFCIANEVFQLLIHDF